MGGGGGGGHFPPHGGAGGGFTGFQGGPPHDRFKSEGLLAGRGPPPMNQTSTGCVMMIYGLDMRRVNCERLFNLFCLYGNVARVSYKHGQ